ncbi:MAG: quaternary ammonium transporter [Chloroflexota bacterium]|nr:quaternary ammonium transporter [Chloroflexota bacterium]
MLTRRTFVRGAVSVPLIGGLALAAPRVGLTQENPVRIGSKDFTEQFILGEMYGLLLENADIPIELKLNLGGTGIAHAAIVNNEIDLYPEYTGTSLTEVLKIPVEEVAAMATPVAASPAASPAAEQSIDQLVYDRVAQEYKDQFNLVLLEQVPFNNTQALAVKREFAEERGISTISQLVEIANELTISAPVDFPERQDGMIGLQRVYGDFEFGEILGVAPGIKYQAIEQGEAEVVLAFGTDGEIFGLNLMVLTDDKALWPPYHVAPVVRQETLDTYPTLAPTINAVARLLTDEVMSGLNYQVSGPEKKEPEEVARAFLQENGLIPAE